MSSKDILKSIIEDFNIERFENFFREKNDKLRFPNESICFEDAENNFTDGKKLAEGELDDGKLIVCSIFVNKELSERSGKKAQYILGKNILKEEQADAGIFIFYDKKSNFRFSLIYTNYSGKSRDWSSFKRFTYYVNPEHTNKTFLHQVGEGDFSTIEKIKEAFSVEPVTKQFYNEIQSWYFWAMDKIMFPDDYKYSDDPKKNLEIRNATNLIRLLTRIIFIWFLKEKELIPNNLFKIDELKKIVKDCYSSLESKNYYNAIIQNLFFATLNQKMGERRFASEEGYLENKKEYGVKNLYRYLDKFLINKDEILKLFKDIPFLNGGLFDCLDKEDETGKVIYIDGFSRNPKKQAIIPDYLFFEKNEEKVDLSLYGFSEKSVRGLIEILNSYNFSIDENTPVDQEIALDPELLGKIFENLLASYNPETATTARKSTGSYYTPREIVDYMVETSIFEYLKVKYPEIDEDKFKKLVSYSEDIPDFSEEDKRKIIDAIDKIKILDPACGSGAFPMGMLHKLVLALEKIDPDNKLWQERQYQKILKHYKEIEKSKNDDKKEILKELNETFDETLNNPNYARKLYLIENSIYGVDIQPIAVQIAKLRFFISLLIEQKTNNDKEKNYGIKPLPNLETKFVVANTLIGLEDTNILYSIEVENLKNELLKLRERYFKIKTKKDKVSIKNKDKEIRKKMLDELKKAGFPETVAEKIAKFDIFNQNISNDWFDPEWMFGIKDGFDIVIGNPPYGNILNKDKNGEFNSGKFVKNKYKYSTDSDIASPFIEKGINLLREKGNLVYIITYAITFNKDFSKNRNQLNSSFEKVEIYSFDRDKCRIFKSMSQSVSILKAINKNTGNNKGIYTSIMFREMPDIHTIKVNNCKDYLLPKTTKYYNPHRLPKLGEDINLSILNKLFAYKEFISQIIRKTGIKIWIRTSGNYWYNAFDRKPYESVEISFLYLDKDFSNFLILLINSSLFYFWFRIYGDARHMNMDILGNFSLPNRDTISKYNILLSKMKERFMEKLFSVFDKKHKRFETSKIKSEIDLVDLVICKYLYNLDYEEILHIINYDFEVRTGNKLPQEFLDIINQIINIKKQNPQADTGELEREIDKLVFRLYDLTEEEINIIEGEK
ncbi:MAG: Uncharacterized protein XD76_0252 [candidate division TA06 bacterium 32_111]|uniref:site-specific DNA-methyltransferase (adenine-specific) n=2 Tax=Bacteria candidate phyla TaxID=1783234 RepID=A0A124G0J9_UNCT6|nr:MAG: Uncharacterized protein XD76_0252 [candidate division TA06 bacterium 32_111]KUK87715.1 MAG: Uncharacterized protein XE03_0606 [candidate division TA06 bacterium 34_109]HAF07552.1 type II restriction endonuclease [candidate division WOR-3 bacterium]HCP17621.1 type II restriction endonuclease [candidate division WOR-3 bacterium]